MSRKAGLLADRGRRGKGEFPESLDPVPVRPTIKGWKAADTGAAMDASIAANGLGPILWIEAEAGSGPLASLTDEALMQRFQQGDGEAFEALYRRRRAQLHRFLRRMTSDSEADEIFQEVWFAVIRGKARYAPTARFVTYLFAIAHRRAADHFRKKGRGALALEDNGQAFAEEDVPDAATPLSALQNAELGKALHAAIAGLPLAQREAFLMQAEGELSLDEIAGITCVPRETIKSRLRYASRHLRKQLADWT